MPNHQNPLRNFAFFIVAATIGVVVFAFAVYLSIGMLFQ
ncbi:hypothetical protein JOE67_000859 [Microbacterium esteraromaticum]|nr:hypothetical protein [Microbacterium esteraromaticum]